MAIPCPLYQLEETKYLFAIAEPCKTLRESAYTAVAPDTNNRPSLQNVARVARDLPTEEVLCLEIEKLCTAALTIDEAFYDIGRKLSSVSKEQNRRLDVYEACFTLETQWNEHHLTYQHLIWRSREFAGEAQGAVDDFREVVLPSLRDRGRLLSEKREIIQEQIKVLEDTSQPSQRLCQEFLDFGRALDTYIGEFSRVVEGFGIGEQTKSVDGLEYKLRDAKDAMDAVSREVKELGWKFAIDIAVTGISFLLAILTPALWSKLADPTTTGIDFKNVKRSGLQFFDARRRSDVATKEYQEIKARLGLERACLAQMVKLEFTLHDSRPLVQEVTVKLGILTSVWAAITADIRKLKTSLQLADNTTPQLFIIRVQRLEKMYGYLSQALRLYQVTVQRPK